MSLGWVEDVVKDGKVVLQNKQPETSELVDRLADVNPGKGELVEITAQDSVGPPPTTLGDSAIAV